MTSLDCRIHDPVVTRHRPTLPIDVAAIARDIERAASVPYREPGDELAARVVAVCEDTYGIRAGTIRGPSRRLQVAIARQAAYWCLRQAGWSWPRCARAANRADHTSSIHGARRTEWRNKHEAYALRRNLGVLDACGIERPQEHR